jgi:hypothetical protein
MPKHWIEIDDSIFKYLQKNAEPLVDTPNSVLHKLLFNENYDDESSSSQPISFAGLPVSLAQILEVVYEIERNGYSRPNATRLVADRRGTVPQTIMDKYCKQLGLRAKEVDLLLEEHGYGRFMKILNKNFPEFKEVIEIYFGSITLDSGQSSEPDQD